MQESERATKAGTPQKDTRSGTNKSRHAKKRDPAEDLGRVFLFRLAALAAFCCLCVIASLELLALRGALGYMRFDLERRAAIKANTTDYFVSRVRLASSDAEAVLAHGQGIPLALWEASNACLRWAVDERIADPLMRLQLLEKAVKFAAGAVEAAPSDYLMWQELARGQLVLGLGGAAQQSLDRAQELAPPGKKLKIGPLEGRAPTNETP